MLAADTVPSFTSSLALTLRDDTVEHVVLANCKDEFGIKSSQMAYYSAAINPYPSSVANVTTPNGQTATWEGTGPISATFPDGDIFTVNIPAVVSQGQYAGPGNNNYGPFTCWYNWNASLYHWGGNTCDEVYDCNHQAAPITSQASATSGIPQSYTSSSLLATTPASTTSAPHANTLNNGLSVGSEVGSIVGAIAGIAAVMLSFFIYWRKRGRNKSEGAGNTSTQASQLPARNSPVLPTRAPSEQASESPARNSPVLSVRAPSDG
jgi:hypothetical protein